MKKFISILVSAGATLMAPQFAQAADLGGYEERETYVERPRVIERERIIEQHHHYEPRYVERYVEEPEFYYRPRRVYYYATYPRRFHRWQDYRYHGNHAYYRDHRQGW